MISSCKQLFKALFSTYLFGGLIVLVMHSHDSLFETAGAQVDLSTAAYAVVITIVSLTVFFTADFLLTKCSDVDNEEHSTQVVNDGSLNGSQPGPLGHPPPPPYDQVTLVETIVDDPSLPSFTEACRHVAGRNPWSFSAVKKTLKPISASTEILPSSSKTPCVSSSKSHWSVGTATSLKRCTANFCQIDNPRTSLVTSANTRFKFDDVELRPLLTNTVSALAGPAPAAPLTSPVNKTSSLPELGAEMASASAACASPSCCLSALSAPNLSAGQTQVQVHSHIPVHVPTPTFGDSTQSVPVESVPLRYASFAAGTTVRSTPVCPNVKPKYRGFLGTGNKKKWTKIR